MKKCKDRFINFKQNNKIHALMKIIKQNKILHKYRYLDPLNPKSSKKSWYSKAIYKELSKFYK